MKHLALGEFFVNIGRAILLLSFIKFLYDQTGQLWALSLVFIAELVLTLVIPILAGGAVDARGAKRILRYSSAASIAVCLVSALVVADLSMSTPVLLVTSIVLSAVNPIIRLSVFSVTPEISSKENLNQNNGWLVFAFQAGQLSGIGFAALLLTYSSLSIILLFVSFAYLASFCFYHAATGNLDHRHFQQKACNKGTEQEALSAVRRFRELARVGVSFAPMLILSNFDFAIVAVFNLLLAPIVFAHYDGSPMWLSALDASFAIGALAGGMIIARKWWKKKSDIGDSALAQSCFMICLLVFLVPTLKYMVPVFIVLFGISLSFSIVFWNTRLQKDFPVAFKGRLAGARNLMSSLYIGLISMVVSSAHQLGFETAVAVSMLVAALHLVALLILRKSYAPTTA